MERKLIDGANVRKVSHETPPVMPQVPRGRLTIELDPETQAEEIGTLPHLTYSTPWLAPEDNNGNQDDVRPMHRYVARSTYKVFAGSAPMTDAEILATFKDVDDVLAENPTVNTDTTPQKVDRTRSLGGRVVRRLFESLKAPSDFDTLEVTDTDAIPHPVDKPILSATDRERMRELAMKANT